MISEKYNNADSLVSFDLNVKIFENYDFTVDDIYPVDDYFVIHTDKGEMILKKMETIEKVRSTSKRIARIKKSFDGINDLIKGKDGETFINWGGNIYCLFNMPNGRISNLNDPSDLISVSKTLAMFHMASSNYQLIDENNSYYNKLIDNSISKLKKIRFYKLIAEMHRNKSDFDKMFLSMTNFYENQCENSINLLNEYYNVKNLNNNKYICHHNLFNKNIIIDDQKEKVFFIGLDRSIIDSKIHDLCNLINKIIYSSNIDIAIVIDNYCSVFSITKPELNLLNAMITFPENFYHLAKCYYESIYICQEEILTKKIHKLAEYESEKIKNMKYLNNILKNF